MSHADVGAILLARGQIQLRVPADHLWHLVAISWNGAYLRIQNARYAPFTITVQWDHEPFEHVFRVAIEPNSTTTILRASSFSISLAATVVGRGTIPDSPADDQTRP